MKLISIILITIFSFSSYAADQMSLKGNRNVKDFAEAKRILPKIFQDHQTTLYCGCKYCGKDVNMNSCGAANPNQGSRFKKLEWEHVVDAHSFAKVVSAWNAGAAVCNSKKGRKCAAKASSLFRQMEGDLYNLWPESGGINGARSDKQPVERIKGEAKAFGSCKTLIGKKEFSPRPEVRGKIARTYLYMADAYEIPLSADQMAMFTKWNRENPVDAWECERSRRIKAIQGNANRFVESQCAK